jgi:hypothetical protein
MANEGDIYVDINPSIFDISSATHDKIIQGVSYIVEPSTAASSNTKASSARVSRGSCCSQDNDKRYALYFSTAQLLNQCTS